MGVNVLGPRKTRAVARFTGLEIVHAVVWSHHDSGRDAHFTTADHRHGVLDRKTGTWEVSDPQPQDEADWDCRQDSCRYLFGKVPLDLPEIRIRRGGILYPGTRT